MPVTSRIGNPCRIPFRCGLRGATVARLTPDQKVACSNHVGVIEFFRFKPIIIFGILQYFYKQARIITVKSLNEHLKQASCASHSSIRGSKDIDKEHG